MKVLIAIAAAIVIGIIYILYDLSRSGDKPVKAEKKDPHAKEGTKKDDHEHAKKAKPAPYKDQGGWILLFICLLLAGIVAAFFIGRGDIHFGKKNKVDKEEKTAEVKSCETTSVTLVSKIEDNIATITMDASVIKEGYIYRVTKIWLDGNEVAVSEADGAELYTNTLTEFDFGPGETYILSDLRYTSKMYEGPIKTRKLLFYWYDSVSIVLTGECQQ